jgi:hypothetical protein
MRKVELSASFDFCQLNTSAYSHEEDWTRKAVMTAGMFVLSK